MDEDEPLDDDAAPLSRLRSLFSFASRAERQRRADLAAAKSQRAELLELEQKVRPALTCVILRSLLGHGKECTTYPSMQSSRALMTILGYLCCTCFGECLTITRNAGTTLTCSW